MATFTENYDLIKPSAEDYYDVQDFNENMDAIDGQMAETAATVAGIEDKIGSPTTEGDTVFSLLSKGNSPIKSIQRVEYAVTVANSTSGTVEIDPVNPDRCIIISERLGSSSGYFDYSLEETLLTVYHGIWNPVQDRTRTLLGFWIIEFY